MSAAGSWVLVLTVLAVGATALYGLVRLLATATAEHPLVAWLNLWCEDRYGSPVGWDLYGMPFDDEDEDL